MPSILARLVRWEYALKTPLNHTSYKYVDLVFRDAAGHEYYYHIPDRRETIGRRLREFWAAYGKHYDPLDGCIQDASDCTYLVEELHMTDTPVLIRVSDARGDHRITSLRPVKQEA